MMPHTLKVALLGCALAFGGGMGCAVAQESPPPGAAPRCGGLLCDLGVFGGPESPTTLPCDDFFCRAFGSGRSAQAAPPPAPVAEPEPAAPVKTARRKRMAKAHGTKVSKKDAMSKPDATEGKPEGK